MPEFHQNASIARNTRVSTAINSWFDDRVGDTLEQRISDLSKALAAGFGCTAHVLYQRRFPATINYPDAARFVRDVAGAPCLKLKVIDAAPSMASEDFAFMLQAVPGCYLWLGAGESGHDHGLHSSCYDFNDKLLPLGVALWVALVQKSLHRI